MTPKPESETFPWAGVKATYADIAVNKTARVYLADVVDAARAAEAAQHQHEIADLTATIKRYLADAEASDARLAAVEAERDKQAEQIAMLLTICPNCAGLMAPEPPDSGCSGVYCPECRSNSAELRAERDRLKAALQDVTIGMDRAGGDRDGMPECPWCQSQGRPEDAEEGYAHDVDCSLMMARAALTPQGQSTDGETR